MWRILALPALLLLLGLFGSHAPRRRSSLHSSII
jgi:hypothetical protein